jgi:hypothetical protein
MVIFNSNLVVYQRVPSGYDNLNEIFKHPDIQRGLIYE